jgi:hypothetical protein
MGLHQATVITWGDHSITKTYLPMLPSETVVVYCENRTEPINTVNLHYSGLTGEVIRMKQTAKKTQKTKNGKFNTICSAD